MMNRFFTLLLAASCLTAVGQVPDYVPTEGLVAYFPFDGNVLNLVSDDDGLPTEVGFDSDRFGQPSAALAVVGGQTEVSLPLASFAEGGDPRSMSYWLKRADNATDGEPFTGVVYNVQSCGQKSFACGANIYTKGVSVDFSCGALTFDHAASHEECGWNHIVVVVPDISDPRLQDVIVYENGELLQFLTGTSLDAAIATIHGTYTIGGSYFWGDRLYDEADLTCSVPLIDDLAFFNRALSSEEVNQLYIGVTVSGCTDEAACNFNAEADVDDGTCYACDIPASHCGIGTVWDASSQTCIVANPSDSNFDGCVQLNDLLDLLSAYGDCGAEESAWYCGDPLEYQGYYYETVQIGEQCWFAENLRAENYSNGDVIDGNLSASEWTSTTSGAVAVYGEDAGCENFSPDIDACDPIQSLHEYGRLYNWYAVDDARGICPSDWHVPADGEWMTLEMVLGMSESEVNETGERGTDQGVQMKSTYGWENGGNGTNESGFSSFPSGYRHPTSGNFEDAGRDVYWWSSTPASSNAWRRSILYSQEGVVRLNSPTRTGFAIRCIKDAE